jgi:DNA mismatch repair protein PMS2
LSLGLTIQLARRINSAYHEFLPGKYPAVIIYLVLENWNFDVNLAPDKRTILINEEDVLFSWLKDQLMTLFSPFQQSELIYGVDSTELLSPFEFSSQPDLSSSTTEIGSSFTCNTHNTEDDDITLENSCNCTIQDSLTPNKTIQESKTKFTQSNLKSIFGYQANTIAKNLPDTFVQPKKKQKSLSFLNVDSSKKLKRNSIFPLIQGDMHWSINLEDITCGKNGHAVQTTPKKQFHAEISCSTQAEAELSRFVSKQDFKRMQILGQFNLGFIIVRLESDLFVIDQHARYINH